MCDDCGTCVVGAIRIVDGRSICGLCRAFHGDLITLGMYDRIMSEVMKPCRFCGRVEVKKNFDHVNMFHKSGSVGIMVMRGHDETELLKEIDKCQILCVDCHLVVTVYECRCRFTQRKTEILRSGGRMDSIAAEYDVIMTPFYEWMERVGGAKVASAGGCVGGSVCGQGWGVWVLDL
jgi:hypothetical protein